MSDRRKAAIWPFLCMLACLFVLCVTAPRTWWRPGHRPSPAPDIVAWLNSLGPDAALSELPTADGTTANRQPVRPPNRPLQPLGTQTPDRGPRSQGPQRTAESHIFARVSEEHQSTETRTTDPTLGPTVHPNLPNPRTLPSPRSERPSGAPRSQAPVEPPAQAAIHAVRPNPLRGMKPGAHPKHPVVGRSQPTGSVVNKGPRPGSTGRPARSLAATGQAGRPVAPQTKRPPEWARPTTLLAKLDQLVADDVEAAWAERTAQQIRRLTDAVVTLNQEVPSILADLRVAADEVAELADVWQTPRERTSLLRAQHALIRRLDVWDRVLATRQVMASQTEPAMQDGPDQLAKCVAEVASLTDDGSEMGEAWRQYLMLGTLQTLAEPTEATSTSRRMVARQVLQRLRGDGLSRTQRQFVKQDPLVQFDRQLRFLAAEPIDVRVVLADLERFEATAAPHDARRVAEDYEALASSPIAAHQALAQPIDSHYRNANLRVAVSGKLINQLIPQPEPRREPVRDTIAGADVRGRNQISTRLFVRLLPDRRRIRLGLEAHGTVRSKTASQGGPATFFSTGKTAYLARKLILVGPRGSRVWPAVASADSHTQLEDIETRFDRWPLIGNLVRWIAESQHDQRLDEAIWEVEHKVARRARQELDSQADAQIAKLEETLQRERQAALSRFDVRAVPVDIHTTARRIVARMRIAGPDQLGAHTARPRAPSDSQLSLQLHESAAQNLLDDLDLDGHRFTLPELYRTVATKLGQPDIALPDDLPDRASVQFANRDAIQFHCVDGHAQVTLAIAELSLGRQQFRGFQAVASYRPAPSGLDPMLVRDGIIHLNGKRFRTRSQIVLRGVFAKLFPRNQPVHLLPPRVAAHPLLADLNIHQFVIDNGWIGLAVGARTVQ
jgi:hypothetical protein